MHSRDSQERPSLYKINILSIDQLTENLSVLLSKYISDYIENVLFSSEDEIMDFLLEKPAASDDSLSKPIYERHQPIAVVWDSDKGRDWFVGFFKDENVDTTIRIDHLEPQSNDKTVWIRPRHKDIQNVEPIKILPCAVIGEWLNKNRWSVVYVIKNIQTINTTFEQLLNEDA